MDWKERNKKGLAGDIGLAREDRFVETFGDGPR
jgi:hypothetical protein